MSIFASDGAKEHVTRLENPKTKKLLVTDKDYSLERGSGHIEIMEMITQRMKIAYLTASV